jgi:chitinase domain-containing protein 1
MFLEDDFNKLAENVDFFSLMSYDYSSPSRPGPNSPIDWMERFVLCVLSVAQRRGVAVDVFFYCLWGI